MANAHPRPPGWCSPTGPGRLRQLLQCDHVREAVGGSKFGRSPTVRRSWSGFVAEAEPSSYARRAAGRADRGARRSWRLACCRLCTGGSNSSSAARWLRCRVSSPLDLLLSSRPPAGALSRERGGGRTSPSPLRCGRCSARSKETRETPSRAGAPHRAGRPVLSVGSESLEGLLLRPTPGRRRLPRTSRPVLSPSLRHPARTSTNPEDAPGVGRAGCREPGGR